MLSSQLDNVGGPTLLTIAKDWSFWEQPPPPSVRRDITLPKELARGLALIVQGPRPASSHSIVALFREPASVTCVPTATWHRDPGDEARGVFGALACARGAVAHPSRAWNYHDTTAPLSTTNGRSRARPSSVRSQ